MSPPRHTFADVTAARPRAVELRPVDRNLFRTLLHQQASTVTVVTAVAPGSRPSCLGDLGEPLRTGFTATSFTSVSLDPPLVSFCLGVDSSSWTVLARAEHVAVHLLAADQTEAARVFATNGIDRFAAYPGWTPGPFGVPLLGGVLASLLCRVVHRVPAGDHNVVIAEPLALSGGAGGEPLVHHRGGYTTTASAVAA
ncbi:flavin reductase family protein [Micromonospora andamanensis]|uniref:Flavin-dependent reductase n=1 Tax=Micromonospora andamanensis TaxID=1287068 RepID=A0ABQ4I5B3_9ACTN|nr:flavin reductase family protein [Micromonospora andamanensis]GIJ13099.1 flavin-dependent reductase [Micromonospora andamanensis]